MNTWKATAIQVGTVKTTDPLRYHECAEPYEIKVWCVAATDGIHKVLIDTGVDGKYLNWIREYVDPKIQQPAEMNTITALKRIVGWKPDDVDTVINTHLHYDHCGCNQYFTNATIYVQRPEYETAFEQSSPQKGLYAQRFFDKKAISYFRWKFIDGETEILPGIICLPTPGHTYGHQSVLLHTDKGTVCVTGDAVTILENIQNNIEMGVSVDSRSAYESMQKIRIRADYVIPAHEPSIINGESENFPKI